mgnify:CR=1 FL=1
MAKAKKRYSPEALEKAGFTSFIVEGYSEGEWFLRKVLRYTALDGQVYDVPEFFVTDLSSIPTLALWMYSSYDTRPEGAVHDFLYAIQFPKDRADALYKEMSLRLGANTIQATLAHAALRVGGGKAYNACSAGLLFKVDFAVDFMLPSDYQPIRQLVKAFQARHGVGKAFEV